MKSFTKYISRGFVLLLLLGVASATAETLWINSTTGGYLDSSPAIGDLDLDGSPDIVVTSTAGPVFMLDARGNEVWQVDLGERITISPTVADVRGELYVQFPALST